ncbi:MAG: hypothetical protein ACOZF0_09930 [Thermodesulfobacteriota bacterium]
MKYYYLVILILLMSCSSRSGSEIIAKQKIKKNTMEKYDTAIIYIKNINNRSSGDLLIGANETMVEAALTEALEGIGIKKIYHEKETSLKVECHFSIGWGLPSFRRHFKVSAKYITLINIKFIDLLSKAVIGEVEYKKPFFQSDQKNIIDDLINELIVDSDQAESLPVKDLNQK